MKRVWVLVGIILLLIISNVYASDVDNLKKLDGVNYILLPYPTDALASAGFNRDTLMTKVELCLRSAGIKIIDKKASSELKPMEELRYIYLQIELASLLSDGVYSYVINLSVSRPAAIVSMKNNNIESLCCAPVVWQVEKLGIASENKVTESIYTYIVEFVEKFANDFLAANPKTPTESEKSSSSIKPEVKKSAK